MSKNIKIVLGIVIVAVLIVVGVNLSKDTSSDEKIKVGVIGPFSGQYAELGASIQKSIELKGMEYENVEFIFEDSAFDAKKAVSAYNKLVSVDGVDALINVESISLAGFASSLEKDKILTLQVTESNFHKKDTLFQVMPHSSPIFTNLGEAVGEKYDRVAVVYNNADLFVTNTGYFKQGIDSREIVHEAKLSSDADYRTEVTKLLASNPDSTTVFLSQEDGIKFLLALKQQDIERKVKVVCDANMELSISKYIESVGAEMFEGCLSTNLPNQMTSEFTESFKAEYGVDPLVFTDYAYDAATIIGELSKSKKSEWIKLVENTSFNGASGKVVLDENGTREAASEVRIYKDGAFVKFEE